jgi:hypothetical protein
MASAMTMSMNAMAQSDYDMIAVPYEQDAAWDEIVMANDDVVSTGVYIRAAASANSQVVGSLYKGQAAWIVDQGEEWTEIYSGGLTGFVKNEYLVFGEDAEALAQAHGVEGVVTTWTDVKLFTDDSNASGVVRELGSGESFVLLQDNGHWLQVQNGADSMAYVSSDDVSRVLLFDTAVAKDDVDTESTYEETTYEEPTYEEPTYEEPVYEEPTYTEPAYTEPTYEEPVYTEPTYTEPTYTEPTYEEPVYEEPTYTEPTYEEPTYTDTDYDYDDTDDYVDDGIWYDADTDTYYDADGNVIQTGTIQETESYVEDYVDDYVEETEAVYTNSDDVTLLGALIYCEAGNQSYEGMVAVGAVVMNRVYSSSFPNTISEVIYQSGQFTPAYSGTLASALANGVPSTCYEAAAAALAGENPVGSALYFNTGTGKGIRIGDHQFY